VGVLLWGRRIKMCMSFLPHTSKFLDDWCMMGSRGEGSMSRAVSQTVLLDQRYGREAELPRLALWGWQLKTFNNSFDYF